MSLHCPYCEYQCERKNVLSRHLNKYHLDKNEKTTIECQTCKKAYYNLESLRRHLKKRNCESKITIPESEEQIDNSEHIPEFTVPTEGTNIIAKPEEQIEYIETIPEVEKQIDKIYIEKSIVSKYVKGKPLWKLFFVSSVLIIISRIYNNKRKQ